MPSKLYTTLASGRAVISFCDRDSEVGRIIHEAECGFSVKGTDCDELLEKIHYLFENPDERCKMGNNARKYFEQHFTLEHSLQKYIKVIKGIH